MSVEDALKQALDFHGGLAYQKSLELPVFEIRNMREFEMAVKRAGKNPMTVMYHNNCPEAEGKLDQLKRQFPNVAIYKVNTLKSYDIRKQKADGEAKPYFKIYIDGFVVREIKYNKDWKQQQPILIETLTKYNASEQENKVLK